VTDLPGEEVEDEDDFVKVGVKADDEQVEWLWAKPLPDYRAELRNSPWFAYGLNWGDIVRCELDEDGLPWVADVVERSGNRTIRLFFKSGVAKERREKILQVLNERDVWFESTEEEGIYAFNVRPQVDFEELLDFLALQEEHELLIYEDAS
jgi:hypothetical protein